MLKNLWLYSKACEFLENFDNPVKTEVGKADIKWTILSDTQEKQGKS